MESKVDYGIFKSKLQSKFFLVFRIACMYGESNVKLLKIEYQHIFDCKKTE